ncbi:MAG: hypothetical protein M3391_06915 [Actinomycetota bacterium]|nr:hypothetical protein [Actinomycetota bacterium]
MKKTAAAIAMCLLSAGCGLFSDSDSLAEMTVRRSSGSVSIQRGEETFDVVDTASLEPGDIITTEGDARAELRLEGDRAIGLGGGGEFRVGDGRSLEALDGGRLLARVAETTKILVGDVSVISSKGVFRIDRGRASARVGTYRGAARLEAPGQTAVAVEALHQASLTAGELQRAKPYRLSYADPWDSLLLADVIRLDKEVNTLGVAVSRQIGRGRLDRGYFRRLADRDVGFMRKFMSSSNADLLIGFAIARSVDGDLPAAFKRAFKLFGDGAQWGVAATLLGARPDAVVASLEKSILSTGALAAALGEGAGERGDGPLAASSGASASGTSPAQPASSSSDGSGSPSDGSGGSGPGGSGPGEGGDGGGDGDGDGGGDGDGDGGGGGDDGGCDNLIDCSIEELPLPSISPLIDELPLDGQGP